MDPKLKYSLVTLIDSNQCIWSSENEILETNKFSKCHSSFISYTNLKYLGILPILGCSWTHKMYGKFMHSEFIVYLCLSIMETIL